MIDLMHGYVARPGAYRASDPDGDGLPSLRRRRSSAAAGTRDGLYWPDEPGAPESPIGDFMARAAADGYSVDGTDVEPEPYLGYYFRVLPKQGAERAGRRARLHGRTATWWPATRCSPSRPTTATPG